MTPSLLFFSTFLFAATLFSPVFGRVVLKDSSVIVGTVREVDDSLIQVDNAYLGTIVIPKNYLLTKYGESSSTSARSSASGAQKTVNSEVHPGQSNEPNTNLVFVPTARTCKKGVFDFKDFELLFLTLSGAPTNTTILSAGFLFPVNSDFQIYSFAVKQQVYATRDGMFAAALMGQISKPVGMDDIRYFWNTFAIGSLQLLPEFSLHGSVLFSGGERMEWYYSDEMSNGYYSGDMQRPVTYTSVNYMTGMEVVPAPHVKLMVEFFDNLGILDAFGDETGDFHFINFAIRLFWPTISVDIAGLRPIADVDFGSLLLIPFVNVSFRFGGTTRQ